MGKPTGGKSSNGKAAVKKKSNATNRDKPAINSSKRTTSSKSTASSRKKGGKPGKSGLKAENLILCAVLAAAVGLGIMFYLQDNNRMEHPDNVAVADPAEESATLPSLSASPTPSPSPPTTPSPTPSQTPSSITELQEDPEDTEVEIPVTIRRIEQLTLPNDISSPYNLSFGSPFDENGKLSNNKLSWYFNRNGNHQPPTAQRNFDIRTLNGHYLGDISQKVVYLTFDEGYEHGFTDEILDILAQKNVQAAFFVTLPYIKSQPNLIRRMINEGHLVCNHSVGHKSSPDLMDEELEYEIKELERYFEENFDAEMARFFRPPMGEYSARTLALTDNLGYKTIFWSFAYQDWLVDNQPGADVAYQTVMNNLHNGMLILLHAVSESNTQALPDIIDSIREQGYKFESLLMLEN